jgi:hypothetical protein
VAAPLLAGRHLFTRLVCPIASLLDATILSDTGVHRSLLNSACADEGLSAFVSIANMWHYSHLLHGHNNTYLILMCVGAPVMMKHNMQYYELIQSIVVC